MTYASGGLIEATDYNGFVASVNAIWGTGSSDSGYGQTTTLSTVTAASSTVTATQWSDLIARINRLRNHQTAGGLGSGITQPSTGNTITYLSSLSTQISTATSNKLLNAGDGNAAAGGSGTTAVSNATGWTTTRSLEISYTFLSANQMRYFFNTGGFFDFNVTASALSGNTKSTDFDALCTAFGTTRIKAQSSSKEGGSGSLNINNTNAGFYDLTTSYTDVMRQFSTTAAGGYTSNFITSSAKLNAAPGSSTVISLRIILTDNAADTIDDTVSGTTTLNTAGYASGVTYIANTWGTFTGAVTVAG